MKAKLALLALVVAASIFIAGCITGNGGTEENRTLPTWPTPVPTEVSTPTGITAPVGTACVVGSPIGCFDGNRKVVPRSETKSTTGDVCLVTVGNATTSEEYVLVCW